MYYWYNSPTAAPVIVVKAPCSKTINAAEARRLLPKQKDPAARCVSLWVGAAFIVLQKGRNPSTSSG